MEHYLIYNGRMIPSDQPVVHAGNRGLRYGDGIFETFRIKEGRIILADFHYQRLFSGLQLLQFELPQTFTKEMLSIQVQELCRKNNLHASARIRLMVFGPNGSLFDPPSNCPDYIIESNPLSAASPEMDDKGMRIDVFPDGRKAIDLFSNLKSNNYLLQVMAVKYAKNRGYEDCLVLNSNERICESSIANIFCVKNEKIYTPPLSEGCVAGVIRRFLVEEMIKGKYPLEKRPMDIEFVRSADEIFLTNSIQGIRWVEYFGNRQYGNSIASQLYRVFINPIF